MSDQRIQNLAKVLVKYSTRAQPEEVIGITSSTAAMPLIEASYEELLKAGAWPVLDLAPPSKTESFFKNAKPHHLDTCPPHIKSAARQLDGVIRVEASSNTRALNGVSPDKQTRLSKSSKAMRSILIKKKWVITLFPTQAHAQDADMSLTDFEDFVYSATFADQDNPIRCWKNLSKRQEKLIAKLKGARKVRIVGKDTDLSMSIAGRTFINSPGIHNMPSGEIFTGPVEDSVEGHISYDYPVCNAGREIDGIRLVFRKGKVVEASADKNEKFLLSMLDMDKGARYIGELGIGTNFGIQKFTKNILFDEKIGGSIHLALGDSYPETGGKNKSALHWDMIKDLRKGGALYVDDKVIQKDGKFVI